MHPGASLRLGPRILLPLLACAIGLSAAHATERAGEAAALYELRQYENAAAALDTDFRSLIEASPSEERFGLYWTYNHLIGSWSHVEDFREQLKLSVEADSYPDPESVRTTLRDQAQFVHWELGYEIDDLEKNAPAAVPLNHAWIKESLRWLLTVVRSSVYRLWMDQCAYMPCVADP